MLQNTKKARAGVGIVLIKDAIGLEPENRKGARSYATVANQSAEHAVAAADDSVRLREVRENCYQAVERDCISVVANLLSITATPQPSIAAHEAFAVVVTVFTVDYYDVKSLF